MDILKRYFIRKEANRISKKFNEEMTKCKLSDFRTPNYGWSLPYIPEVTDCYELIDKITDKNKYDYIHRFKDLLDKINK